VDFQNSVLPARAKPTMVRSEPTRIAVQAQPSPPGSRSASSTRSLPRKPLSGGMPAMAMAAAKKSAANRPFCTVAGFGLSVSPRRVTTRSAIRNRQAAAKVECTM
jgi:hypothetical protein